MQCVRVWAHFVSAFLLTYSQDNTNQKHLELYSILGEYDNAGFPLAYCLLSTAESLEINKRTTALIAWATALRDKYGVYPVFMHINKDMAEIGMLRSVWINSKIQLCWWHLRKAMCEQLAKGKLSTTPYDALQAQSEFPFIDITFTPKGGGDVMEYESGARDATGSKDKPPPRINAFPIRLPPLHISNSSALSCNLDSSCTPPYRKPSEVEKENLPPPTPTRTPSMTFTIKIPPCISNQHGSANQGNVVGKDDKETQRHTFCPPEFHEAIIDMMKCHLCTHPLIPGFAHPSPAGIREWAIRQMYQFCLANNLREVWAYLWENWYRSACWELWARSVHEMIPISKTTMICESQ